MQTLKYSNKRRTVIDNAVFYYDEMVMARDGTKFFIRFVDKKKQKEKPDVFLEEHVDNKSQAALIKRFALNGREYYVCSVCQLRFVCEYSATLHITDKHPIKDQCHNRYKDSLLVFTDQDSAKIHKTLSSETLSGPIVRFQYSILVLVKALYEIKYLNFKFTAVVKKYGLPKTSLTRYLKHQETNPARLEALEPDEEEALLRLVAEEMRCNPLITPDKVMEMARKIQASNETDSSSGRHTRASVDKDWRHYFFMKNLVRLYNIATEVEKE